MIWAQQADCWAERRTPALESGQRPAPLCPQSHSTVSHLGSAPEGLRQRHRRYVDTSERYLLLQAVCPHIAALRKPQPMMTASGSASSACCHSGHSEHHSSPLSFFITACPSPYSSITAHGDALRHAGMVRRGRGHAGNRGIATTRKYRLQSCIGWYSRQTQPGWQMHLQDSFSFSSLTLSFFPA